MKTTMQAALLAVVGMALAAPAWGQASVRFVVDPDDPLRCEVAYSAPSGCIEQAGGSLILRVSALDHDARAFADYPIAGWNRAGSFNCYGRRFLGNSRYAATLVRAKAFYTAPSAPSEPEASGCDHLAIVPAMPRALSGDEGSPDHWLHVVNPGAASIRFTIEGRDMAGTKAGTYRRELPAYRGVRVNMRDVEAAFDVSKPAGWWRLVVTGSGPLEVVATMRQGDERRFVPVRTPATCGTGAVTRTGE